MPWRLADGRWRTRSVGLRWRWPHIQPDGGIRRRLAASLNRALPWRSIVGRVGLAPPSTSEPRGFPGGTPALLRPGTEESCWLGDSRGCVPEGGDVGGHRLPLGRTQFGGGLNDISRAFGACHGEAELASGQSGRAQGRSQGRGQLFRDDALHHEVGGRAAFGPPPHMRSAESIFNLPVPGSVRGSRTWGGETGQTANLLVAPSLDPKVAALPVLLAKILLADAVQRTQTCCQKHGWPSRIDRCGGTANHERRGLPDHE